MKISVHFSLNLNLKAYTNIDDINVDIQCIHSPSILNYLSCSAVHLECPPGLQDLLSAVYI